ncbi:YfiR family protein [Aeromonas hydrophila]|uniref:YfiR family protein n=1 Tax=Aeromonas hydrophila TaxID=644 RepID=UPI0030171399
MGADMGLSAGTMHSFSLIRILVWLAPLVCTLALSTEPPPLTSAELRAEQVRQTVLDILSYTRWPTEPSELRLCVAAPTEYATALFSIKQQANGRPVVDDKAIGPQCDVLYLGVLSPERRLPLFEHLRGYPILSISEHSTECVADSVFCLQIGKERIRFRVNLDALARSGVRVHPAVLKLAKANEGGS